MKKLSAILPVAALVVAGAGAASAQVTGVFEAYGGGLATSQNHNQFVPATVPMAGLTGSIAGKVMGVNVQGDFRLEGSGPIGGTTVANSDPRNISQVGVHLGYNLGAFTLGIAAQSQTASQLYPWRPAAYSASRAFRGGELAFTGGSFAVFGQFGVTDFVNGWDRHSEMISGSVVKRVGVRYYPNAGSSMTAIVNSVDAVNNIGNNRDPISILSTDVSYERQFSSNPNWSWNATAGFMRYFDSSHRRSNPQITIEKTLTVGVKYAFGGGASLQDRDASYAWWGMPNDMRAHAYSYTNH